MKLVHSVTGVEVHVGDMVESFRGERAEVTGWIEPKTPASSGRIEVRYVGGVGSAVFYPSVFDHVFVEREDRA